MQFEHFELLGKQDLLMLIRVITPEGSVRELATGLLDDTAWSAVDFTALCQRWRIEEAFKRLKHRLHLQVVSELLDRACVGSER
ncbi:hypothetical protein AWB78_08498 [Caballeronia calidae]|uniref:Transposase IS4-like domain-containing protein n=1 Tax=Caballeronia calidae TaxID=1777139 RepID=A0A158EK15_9BURK|nr:hypothetical protein [Caballeronia calidae]SAL07251.1 hypothetical protein AWB78_08498 [Caballeronia calidae]